MATIDKDINVYYRPSWAGTPSEYSFFAYEILADDDYIFVAKTTIKFENNIDTRAAQVDLIDKALEKLNADHYAKKTALETRRNELLAIGCDGGAE